MSLKNDNRFVSNKLVDIDDNGYLIYNGSEDDLKRALQNIDFSLRVIVEDKRDREHSLLELFNLGLSNNT